MSQPLASQAPGGSGGVEPSRTGAKAAVSSGGAPSPLGEPSLRRNQLLGEVLQALASYYGHKATATGKTGWQNDAAHITSVAKTISACDTALLSGHHARALLGQHFIGRDTARDIDEALERGAPHHLPARMYPKWLQGSPAAAEAAAGVQDSPLGPPSRERNARVADVLRAVAAFLETKRPPAGDEARRYEPSQRFKEAADAVAAAGWDISSGVEAEDRLDGVSFGVGARISEILQHGAPSSLPLEFWPPWLRAMHESGASEVRSTGARKPAPWPGGSGVPAPSPAATPNPDLF